MLRLWRALLPNRPYPCQRLVHSYAPHHTGARGCGQTPADMHLIEPTMFGSTHSYCLVHHAAPRQRMMRRHPTLLLTRGRAAIAGTVVKAPRPPPPPQIERTNRGRRLLQGGGLTGALAPGARASRPFVHARARVACDCSAHVQGVPCLLTSKGGIRLRHARSISISGLM